MCIVILHGPFSFFDIYIHWFHQLIIFVYMLSLWKKYVVWCDDHRKNMQLYVHLQSISVVLKSFVFNYYF
jgi:hypothetical protein